MHTKYNFAGAQKEALITKNIHPTLQECGVNGRSLMSGPVKTREKGGELSV